MPGLFADSPEVTGSASIVPISTSKSQSHPQTTSPVSLSPSNSSTSGSDVAEIVVGVVGGIIGMALIAGIAIRFIIRRRRARSAPSDEFYIDGQSDMREAAAPHPPAIETPKTYVRFFPFLFAWSRTGV
jgi:hypothetical protein